jgi:hypothetical protein
VFIKGWIFYRYNSYQLLEDDDDERSELQQASPNTLRPASAAQVLQTHDNLFLYCRKNTEKH